MGKNEYESNMTLYENRIKYLEQTVSELKPVKQQSKYNEDSIDALTEKSKSLVSTEAFEAAIHDFELTMSDKMEQISSSKCSVARSKKIQESTKVMCTQISAIESMLHCKVDKSQISLFDATQKQLESLERFRDQISEQVCLADDQISDLSKDLALKIDEGVFREQHSSLQELITKKVDMSFLNEQVIKRLNTLLPDLLVLLKEHKQVSPTRCLEEVKSVQMTVQTLADALGVNKQNIESILKSLYNVPSIQQMEIKADKQFCRNLTEDCKAFCTQTCDQLKLALDASKDDIDKLQALSNSLAEKTKVALRFVDWYSSAQLET